jgi:hypothetical protein
MPIARRGETSTARRPVDKAAVRMTLSFTCERLLECRARRVQWLVQLRLHRDWIDLLLTAHSARLTVPQRLFASDVCRSCAGRDYPAPVQRG